MLFMSHAIGALTTVNGSSFHDGQAMKNDDKADERRATNIMLMADSSFTNIKSRRMGPLNPTHGFSSFRFIPQTQDTIIVALKTEEDQGRIASYIMAFTTNGDILMEEQKIGEIKFEGIEFI